MRALVPHLGVVSRCSLPQTTATLPDCYAQFRPPRARCRYLRHPSYFGWYWWSVGTQVLLANPLCTLAYAYVVCQFFRNRIPYEEAMLLDFFPGEYEAYMKQSRIMIPFVRGADQWLEQLAQQRQEAHHAQAS